MVARRRREEENGMTAKCCTRRRWQWRMLITACAHLPRRAINEKPCILLRCDMLAGAYRQYRRERVDVTCV